MNKNTGRFAFFRQLLVDDITCIFGQPGTSEENLMNALQDEEFREIRYFLSLHEGSAVAMGEGYARASGKPAMVQLHSYAGLANGLAMIEYARRGCTPMVIFAGEAGLKYEAMDGQMAADLVAMTRPFVKSDYNGPCAWRVVDPNSILRLLRRAIKTALTHPMGPVFLCLPMDILDQENSELLHPTSLVSTAVTPEESKITAAASLLVKANNPLILIGDGIAKCKAQEALTTVAELIGCEVYAANSSDVNIPASHPLFVGYTGWMFGEDSKKIINERDVILICGTKVFPEVFPATDEVIPQGTTVIHFDINMHEIAKNFQVHIGAFGDLRLTLLALAKKIGNLNDTEEFRQKARQRAISIKEKKLESQQVALEKDQEFLSAYPMHASIFMRELSKRIPDNAIFFDEALTTSPEIRRYIPQDKIDSYFQTRAGMLGTGLPGAIGLKIAHPDKKVFCFCGDGGALSSIQSLYTASRYNIGVKFIICNNLSYRLLKYNEIQYRKENDLDEKEKFHSSYDLPGVDFVKVAEGLGIRSLKVESPDEVTQAVNEACKDDNPLLIDLVISSQL
jgi:thiamine pyrophosphate-dependent acetolactate synthase large subunit-like protein